MTRVTALVDRVTKVSSENEAGDVRPGSPEFLTAPRGGIRKLAAARPAHPRLAAFSLWRNMAEPDVPIDELLDETYVRVHDEMHRIFRDETPAMDRRVWTVLLDALALWLEYYEVGDDRPGERVH